MPTVIYENGVPREMTVEEAAEFEATRASPLPAQPFRRIAALAFRRRLGARRAAITLAAAAALRADPPDPTVQVMLDDLTAARWVDLDEAETVAGLQLLVDRGLLTSEERDRLIVDGQPGEEPA